MQSVSGDNVLKILLEKPHSFELAAKGLQTGKNTATDG